MKKILLSLLTLSACSLSMMGAKPGPMGETLDRGLIAMKTSSGVFISWRALSADSRDMTYDIYRDGIKIHTVLADEGTNYQDPAGTTSSKYQIKGSDGSESKLTAVESDVYKRVKLDRPATLNGATYSPNDCSVGDVDGDGEYELFVKWDPDNSHDNSENGTTSNVYIDCYKLDGTKLWRVDLGPNIRAGAHYTQFMVYDFDGDGKAEMAVKTAPGTKDGKGNNVILGNDDPTKKYANSNGHVISGPEYLTVFDGLTGAERATVYYEPARDILTGTQWGNCESKQTNDNYNRPERYLACVAYLGGDNASPSIVMCRGYYSAAYVCAWDFDGTKLTKRWMHSSTVKGEGLYGEGAHSLTVGDVDNDGCDEIIYGAAAVDHDGTLLHRTHGGHGDALHLGDFLPDRPGLEVFMVHEEKTASVFKYDATLRDAKTGEMIWYKPNSGNDIGRGIAGAFIPSIRGYQFSCEDHTTGAKKNVLYDITGAIISEKAPDMNFRIYWDGDLFDETFDGRYSTSNGGCSPRIGKPKSDYTKGWDYTSIGSGLNVRSCNTTKATPNLQADIFGDWREEIILWDGDNSSDLLIFSTTIPSQYRIPTLMEDHNYRLAIAWQNTAYNQPPHLGFYLPDYFATDAALAFTGNRSDYEGVTGKNIVPVTGTFVNCTNVAIDGPSWLTLDLDKTAGTFTLTGIPDETGTFSFTLTTEGADNTARLSGSITVIAPVELTEVAAYTFDTFENSADKQVVPNGVSGSAEIKGSATLEDGVHGKAIVFDGTTGYIEQPAYADIQMGNNDFSFEFWFKSTDDNAYMFHKGSIANNADTGTTGNWIGIEHKSTATYDRLTFAIDDDKNKGETFVDATNLFDGKWHHLVAVRDYAKKTIYLYIDGQLGSSKTNIATGAIADNNEPFVLGNVNVNHDNHYDGALDDFHWYKGAMTADVVLEHYQAGLKNISAIEEISIDEIADFGPAIHTLYTVNGVTVATSTDASAIADGVEPGVYILVSTSASGRRVSKIVL